MSQRLHDLASVQEVRPVGQSPRKIGSAWTGANGGGGVIDTGGAVGCAGARAGIGKGGLSLVPTSPSRRTFEFTLGSDNRSSSTRSGTPPERRLICVRGPNDRKGAGKSSLAPWREGRGLC